MKKESAVNLTNLLIGILITVGGYLGDQVWTQTSATHDAVISCSIKVDAITGRIALVEDVLRTLPNREEIEARIAGMAEMLALTNAYRTRP